MSYVEVFAVQQNGDVVSYDAEARNNHVFAPLIWQMLGEKYDYLNKSPFSYILMDPGLVQMWKEWPSSKMTRHELLLLGATFDGAWFRRDALPELIEACKWFRTDYVCAYVVDPNMKPSHPEGVVRRERFDSRAITGVISALERLYNDPQNFRGAAFNCCSANEPFWSVLLESRDDTRPYNIDKDKEKTGKTYNGMQALDIMGQLDGTTEKS